MRVRVTKLAGVLLILAAICGTACTDDEPSANTSVEEPSLQQIVDAVRKPDKVFFAEVVWTQTEPGVSEPSTTHEWYSMDDAATRSEPVPKSRGMTTIYKNDSSAFYDPEFDDYTPPSPPRARPAAAPDGGIMGLDYLSLFLSGDTLHFVGKETHDGVAVLRFRGTHVTTKAETEPGEMPPAGTTFQYGILLRRDNLFPVEIDQSLELPPMPAPSPPATADTGGVPSTTVKFTKVEFVDRSSLPADFFDQAALASGVSDDTTP